MIDTLYIEREIISHPTVETIRRRYQTARVIFIDRYTELFNRKNQNFRLQKEKPALILAKKYGEILHEIPALYGIGAKQNYYFSHILNCPYDCRYCFLQGMFRSADFVLFVNYEDFHVAIEKKIYASPGEKITFFSGYDGDSLALDSITDFFDSFFPLFTQHKTAELEIRTKSIYIQPFLKKKSIPNVIAAYTISPPSIAKQFEQKAPPTKKRIQAIQKLQANGWQVGLRFDPIIYCKDAEKIYAKFYHELFDSIELNLIHSVTLGPFRLPKPVYQNMRKIMPYEPLFAAEQKESLLYTIEHLLYQYISKEKVFLCYEPSSSQALAQESEKKLPIIC